MSSKGGGTALTRRNYRLASDTDKPRSTGIVNEKLLSDYLHHVFPPSTNQGPALASLRKPLGFQDLGAHLEKLLSEGEPAEDSRDEAIEGRLGPQPVVLDHTSGFEGLLFVDDDLLGVIGHSNFSSIRATTCVYKGKWAYEVLISSQGLMQIGWCTLNCRFNQEEGVGDTPDSYAYDGNRVRKWNVTTTNYGKSWAAGDIVSCLIDLDEGTITFCLNGQSLGTAFTNIKTGPGVAYFPAISLSFKESVDPVKCVSCWLCFSLTVVTYPVEGYLPLQNPPTADLMKANKLLGFIKTVLSTSIDTQEERLLEREFTGWRLHGEPTVLITLAHIFNHFAPLMCKVYLVEDVLMNFLLGILEGGGSVDEHPLIQQLLDLFWLLMEDYEVSECLKQLMMSLLRAYRFSPIIPDLGFQIHYLRLTTAVLNHEKSRKYLLNNVLYPPNTVILVKEAGLEELIPTTWWPTHFDKEGKDEREPSDESADERLRRRAYERGCQRLKKRIEVVEELQVQILKLLLNNKDKTTGEASRYIFLNKFRKFLQENASNRGHPTALCPPEYMVCFLHRLITAVRMSWDEGRRQSEEAYVPPQLFYNGKVDYFDLQRLGGLLSHLKKTLKDDLASKANIIIDPAEIQASSMDDLDEDEESGAAQCVIPDANERVIPDANERVIPDANECVIPDTNERVIPDANERVIPDANERVIPDTNERVIPDANERVIPDANERVIPDANERVIPDANERVIPDANERVIPDANERVIPDTNERVIPDANERVIPDANERVIPDANERRVIPDTNEPVIPDANERVISDANERVIPDANERVIPDANERVIPDANERRVIPDTNERVIPDANERVIPDANERVIPDTNERVIPDANERVIPDANERRVIPDTNEPVIPDANERVISDANERVIPDANERVIPDANERVIPDANERRVIPDTNERVIPDANERVIPDANERVIPDANERVIPDTNERVIPDANERVIPDANERRVIPDTNERVIPDANERVIPDANERVIPDANERVIPDTNERVIPDANERVLTSVLSLILTTNERVIPDANERVISDANERVIPDTNERVIPDAKERVIPDANERVIPDTNERVIPDANERRPFGAAVGGALARPSWLSSPTLGRANRFLSTAAVSLMTPRRPLSQPEKVKVRTLAVEQRTEDDIEGSHGNDGLLLGRPMEEPEQPIADKSLLEIVDGIVMMYNLSVHQQLGKMVVVSDDVHEYAVALKDTEEKIARCPAKVRSSLSALCSLKVSYHAKVTF
ncbi:hypothetical protein NQZ68_034147 [Dissostichus eleginoides]|nr:hypothetical protein NQZ68_034147 [Dissostichus eleginoides]